MTIYVKFDGEGGNAVEAPFIMERGGKVVRGYNRPSNHDMLMEDGWLRYDGAAELSRLRLEGGEIREAPAPEPEPKTVFTKLQIRRCMRRHGLEDQLNAIVSADARFKADWDDAQVISLNDEMFVNAIASGLISQEMVALIQSECAGLPAQMSPVEMPTEPETPTEPEPEPEPEPKPDGPGLDAGVEEPIIEEPQSDGQPDGPDVTLDPIEPSEGPKPA